MNAIESTMNIAYRCSGVAPVQLHRITLVQVQFTIGNCTYCTTSPPAPKRTKIVENS